MISILGLVIFWLIFDIPYLIFRFGELLVPVKTRKFKKYPLVTLLVPAFNEEKGIAKTLKSCMNQNYPKLEIIVIDDGSTDYTSDIVRTFQSKHRHYLRKHNIIMKLVCQRNQGKARAMNTGLKNSSGKFILTIDADSYPRHDAVKKIMKYFADDKVGAVAGNIVGVPRKRLLHYLQYLEYEFGILFIKVAQSATSDVTVTPGPFSIYRKEALKRFEEGTITEDFDTTIRILERGYKIVEAPDAICYTQLPLNSSDLIKQRVRWYKGGLQVFAKHFEQKKRATAHLEIALLFFYGFYGLIIRMISFLVIPLMFFMGFQNMYLILLSFFIYSFILIYIQFIPVYYRLREKKIFLVIPVFIVYFYTIILYACLVGQIQIFKNKTDWDKVKRYTHNEAVVLKAKKRWSIKFDNIPYLKTVVIYIIKVSLVFALLYFAFSYAGIYDYMLVVIASIFIAFTFRPLYLISFITAYFMFYNIVALTQVYFNSEFIFLFVFMSNMLWNSLIMIYYVKANYSLDLYVAPEEEGYPAAGKSELPVGIGIGSASRITPMRISSTMMIMNYHTGFESNDSQDTQIITPLHKQKNQ